MNMGTDEEPDIETTYTVQRGDTLAGIALRHSIKVSDLKYLNHLFGSDIYEGQILQIKHRKRQRSKSLPYSDLSNSIPNNPPSFQYKTKNSPSKLKMVEESIDSLHLPPTPSEIDNMDNENLKKLEMECTSPIKKEEPITRARSLSRSNSESASLHHLFTNSIPPLPKLIGGCATEILCDPKYSKNLVEKIEAALPRHFRGYDWNLLYSLAQHGSSLGTLYRKVRNKHPTLLLIETSKQEICGCFASKSWHSSAHYYGNGECFLFTNYPTFQFYPWSFKSSMFMFSNDESIAMGGGGNFGLFLNSDLSKGSSGKCTTFENECLTSEPDFDVLSVEVWEFVTRS